MRSLVQRRRQPVPLDRPVRGAHRAETPASAAVSAV